jgi:hypothetical protein
MALAKKFGFEDYAQPAGGCCFLTDEQYSRKLADLWQSRGEKSYEMDDIMLLKVGRHIRLNPNFKMIVSREEGEGKFMQGYRNQYVSLRTLNHPGPLALIDGEVTEENLGLAARVLARYSKGKMESSVQVEIREKDGAVRNIEVVPMGPLEVKQEWML